MNQFFTTMTKCGPKAVLAALTAAGKDKDAA
jgi:hypothetical protein